MDFSITLIPTVRAAMQTLVGVDGFYSFDLFVTTYADDAHRNLITCHTVPLRLNYGPDESFKPPTPKWAWPSP